MAVSLVFAATRASNVKVLAFEPFPENTDWLRKNVSESHLSNITVYQQAVAAVTEERILQTSDSWTKNLLSETVVKESETANENGHSLHVQCVSFNDIIERIPKCDLFSLAQIV